MSVELLTRGYVRRVQVAVADIPSFPNTSAQDDSIEVNTDNAPATVLQAQDNNVNIKQEDGEIKILNVDDGIIIKVGC